MKQQKSGSLRILLPLLCLLLILSAAGVLYALQLYRTEVRARAQAEQELQQSEVEGTLRTLSAQVMRDAQVQKQQKAEAAARAEQEAREARKEALLAHDRAELLTLVNPWNELPEDYAPRLVDLGDGIYIDERAAGDLTEMLAACYADPNGSIPVPISGYRTQEYQQGLYDNKIERLREAGWSEEDAPAEAAKSVAVPGTSEHQLGLAVDILDVNNSELDITQSWTQTQRWLSAHCAEYGFILRYPDGTSDITGIIFEPWHYRYVGRTLAQEITASGLTFEEYLEQQAIS